MPCRELLDPRAADIRKKGALVRSSVARAMTHGAILACSATAAADE